MSGYWVLSLHNNEKMLFLDRNIVLYKQFFDEKTGKKSGICLDVVDSSKDKGFSTYFGEFVDRFDIFEDAKAFMDFPVRYPLGHPPKET